MYNRRLDMEALTAKVNAFPNVTARLRPRASHRWYDRDNMVTAVQDGMKALGI